MKVLLLGGGEESLSIASRLVGNKSQVTVIVDSKDKISNFDAIGATVILGSYTNLQILADMKNEKDLDIFIATTDNDEINLLSCYMIRLILGIKIRIAKIDHAQYIINGNIIPSTAKRDFKKIGNLIYPHKNIAERIINNLRCIGAKGMELTCDRKLYVFGISVAKENDNILEELNAKGGILVGVSRSDRFTFSPKVKKIKIGDTAYIACQGKSIINITMLLADSKFQLEQKNLVIVGDSGMNYTLIDSFINHSKFKNITIIQSDPNIANKMAYQFPKIRVIHGDILDPKILKGFNMFEIDLCISTYEDDTKNILSSLIVKKLGCQYAIRIAKDSAITNIFHRLDADLIFNRNEVFVDGVIQCIRQDQEIKIRSFARDRFAIIEVEVRKGASTLFKKTIEKIWKKHQIFCFAELYRGRIRVTDFKKTPKTNSRLVMCVKYENIFSALDLLKQNQDQG